MMELFLKGGLMMYPLLICSVWGLYIVIYKFLYLRANWPNMEQLTERVIHKLSELGREKTIHDLRKNREVAHRMMTQALKLADLSDDEVQQGVRALAHEELPRIERKLVTLATIIQVAPILGLLGTVLGLMSIFNVISGGNLGDATALSAGIAEALITTVTGLMIALVLIFPHQMLTHKIEAYISELERAMNDVLRFSRSKGVQP